MEEKRLTRRRLWTQPLNTELRFKPFFLLPACAVQSQKPFLLLFREKRDKGLWIQCKTYFLATGRGGTRGIWWHGHHSNWLHTISTEFSELTSISVQLQLSDLTEPGQGHCFHAAPEAKGQAPLLFALPYNPLLNSKAGGKEGRSNSTQPWAPELHDSRGWALPLIPTFLLLLNLQRGRRKRKDTSSTRFLGSGPLCKQGIWPDPWQELYWYAGELQNWDFF